ncbi:MULTISPECIES: helix-turn-helix domain-containing protein [unclassified Streptomyces]|uniref:helix-turn-helix domain-containing protein n=1 Tax=unclassified Streptomyces TaxID=2593676 RepID=UPI00324EBD71
MEIDETEKLIAERLSEARRRAGWTLAEVAPVVGVSVTHLSRLERGDRQPSIGVLIQLARRYGMSVGQLVGEEPEADCRIFRRGAATPIEGPDGRYRYVPLSGTSGPNMLEAIRLELSSHSRTGRAAQHPGEEWLFVHSGDVRLEVASATHDLAPGDAAHFDAQRPHRLHNAGPNTATVFIITAPSPAGQGSWHR